MLSRLRGNPVIRTGLLAVALGFCGLSLAEEWPQVLAAISRLDWAPVTGALLAAGAGTFCMILAWRAVLADLDRTLPLPAAVRIVSISQVAKYLPGAVWAFAAQVEMGRDYRVARRTSAAAVIISLAIALGTGLLIGTLTLPVAAAGAARRYLWIMALAPLIAACLMPPVLRRLLDKAFALARREPLDRQPTTRGLLTAAGWTMAGWLLWGAQAWFLITDVAGGGVKAIPVAVGGYALAWCAGLLLVLFPGGIGPRELAFVAALAPVMPRGSALLVALVSRVVTTGSDLAWAGAGLVIGRLTRHSRESGAAAEPPARSRGGRHRKPRSSGRPAGAAAEPALPMSPAQRAAAQPALTAAQPAPTAEPAA